MALQPIRSVVKIERVSEYTINKVRHSHERFIYSDGSVEVKHVLLPLWEEQDLPGYLATLKKPYQ